jgi:DNA-binding IclR family transcriptional regulator
MTKKAQSSVSEQSLPQPETHGVQSVWRALDLLEAFPTYGPELGLTSIAGYANMNKATAHRLLATLEARGYVERTSDGRKYRLGVRAFELGAYFQGQLDVRRLALPYLTEMVEQTGEAAFLCIREGDEALCIERVEAEQVVNIFSLRVGGRQPLHCGAAPRALLSDLNDLEVQGYAQRSGLPKLTEHTLATLVELRQDIRQTRCQGYVVSDEDVTPGIRAVGAPVRNHTGKIIAAISLSGLSARFAPQRVDELARILVANTQRISRQMGYREEPCP